MIEFHSFGMPIKSLGSLGKIRVVRVTGNTHIFFWPYLYVGDVTSMVQSKLLTGKYRVFHNMCDHKEL